MRFGRKGLAVLVAALLIVPETPMPARNVLAAEMDVVQLEQSQETGEESVESSGDDAVESGMKNTAESAGGNTIESGVEDGAENVLSNSADGMKGEGNEELGAAETGATETGVAETGAAETGETENAMPETIAPEMMASETVGNDVDAVEAETASDAGESLEDMEGSGEENVYTPYADVIASGSDGDITWVIDAGGKLTVEGTGDFSQNLWKEYLGEITSAEIKVSGMTNASHLFENCTNLVDIDLSGFDTNNVTSMESMFSGCSSLQNINLDNFNTENVTDMFGMFSNCHRLENLDLSSFDTSNVTTMIGMFCNCGSLTSLDLSHFDTSNVITMESMLSGCGSLTSLDLSHFNTSKVITMRHMFSGCDSLTSLDVSHFDTNNVTTMEFMFFNCGSLTSLDVSHFDTSKVTSMGLMFGDCGSLTSLDVSHFNTSNVTIMASMFFNCGSLTSLDLSHFDTSNVTDMGSMFYGCGNLTSLDLSHLDTSNVTNMRVMFYDCRSLTSLDLSYFDTSNVTSMRSMFSGCNSLQNVNLSNFNTENVTDMWEMFSECRNLESLDLSSFNTSNVTGPGMQTMFNNCQKLKSLDLSNFNTEKVTDMFGMFINCHRLEYLDLSGFDTSNVTVTTVMFCGCGSLASLDLSNFDVHALEEARDMLYDCKNLTTIHTPLHLTQSVSFPEVENVVWRLPDGTEVTELPQNRNESVVITRHNIDTDTTEFPALHFRVIGATGYSNDDIYIAENTAQEILDTLLDPFYGNRYQTLFVHDLNMDLTKAAPVFEQGINTEIQVFGQGPQISGESIQDFSKGAVSYTAFFSDEQKSYQVAFVKKENGPKLFVNGPEEREIFLTDYFDNRHTIMIANAGDVQLTGIKAELLEAVNIKLDDTQAVSSTLEAFTQVPGNGRSMKAIMANFGKISLVPDGEGAISGTLKISADGQEPVYIRLTGYSSNPKIITTTEELNMEDVIRVKYVPYSYTVETNNKDDSNRVTFSVAEGKLAEGLQMYPDTGEIYGVPMEAGEFPITVKATYSNPAFLPSYAQLTLIVKENTDGNVAVATDSGYDLVQRVGDVNISSVSGGSQMMVSLGEYREFVALYLDGEKLAEGSDYTSEEGSTRVTILNQTLTSKSVGTHTLGMEFRTQDTRELRRAAQNYVVGEDVNTDNGENGGGEGNDEAENRGGDEGAGDAGNAEAGSRLRATATVITHTVSAGDTLWKIAEKYFGLGTYWTKIYEDNKDSISNPDRIYVGQKIMIYLTKSSAGETRMEGTVYTVQSGDTLWKIARRVYGKGWRWRKIYDANDAIKDPEKIYVGQVIVIPD